MSFEEKVLNYMREGAYKPLKVEDLSRQLGINEKRDIKRFQGFLEEMEQAGKVIKNRYGLYGVPERMNLVVGRLQGHQSGFGFIIQDNPATSDIFVPANQMNGAMHGDTVVARLVKSASSNRNNEGEIIRILQRRSKLIVGRYEAGRQYGFVIPDDQRIAQDIFIPKGEAKQLKNGMKVQVEITRWPEQRRNPEGAIVDVIGFPGEKGVDTLSIIKKHELPEEFPPAVLKELEAYSRQLSAEELTGRRDLRELLMVTIDGADAKDLDDAVSLHKKENGNWELGVHIADVGYYVKEGTALDKEAFQRGTSIYLVDRVIPMLPPELSNDLCSLNPNVDRLAMSAFMEFNHQGQLLAHHFTPSVIRTRERMTYDDVRAILEDNHEDLRKRYSLLVPMFEEMRRLALLLREKRFKRGALDFAVPEIKVKLDDDGKPIALEKRPRTIAEIIIEEFMLVCNETVAEHIFRLKLPFVYRELEAYSRQLSAEELTGRRDLRELLMVTIDGADAKDLDDAVSLHKKENGNWELGVHIADVGYYVKEGTALDKEAFQRGTSIYLVDRVIPMLPPELSNDLCSLNPNVDRLAMSAFMEFNHQGQLLAHHFTPSVIRTRERMTYDDVRAILEDNHEDLRKRYSLLVPMFEEMRRLALLLREKRFKRGALDFAVPEIKVKLDDDGKPIALEKRPRTIAEIIIEEFMLVCNETVAEHIFRLKLPFVYRVHEKPADEKMIHFRDFVQNLGLSIKGAPEKMHSSSLQALLHNIAGKPEERVINTVLLRAMKQARYTSENAVHYGLAAEYYTHFTSPIRRYPDLVIHRLLREYLTGT
ncbi:MAG: VacB/RNase II family 3'-5' exoribonuclease, partial [Firmicutes bacterium]|nr:VacB/RNase II family 3'-5' exoribonuclease [Bacillota bacterium]